MNDTTTPQAAQAIEPVEIPKGYMQNANGGFDPISKIKPQKLEEDKIVKKIAEYADKLSAEISRFKIHTHDDIDALIDVLATEYGIKPSGLKAGGKGNVSFQTYDGLTKVQISVQDRLSFGPELLAAKAKFDEFIKQESKNASHTVKLLLNQAFQLDKEGRINRGKLFALKNFKLDDPLWSEGIRALNDAVTIESTKSYIRIHRRRSVEDAWQPVNLDIAAA